MDYKNQPILKLNEKDLIQNENTSGLENLVLLSMAFGGAVGGVVLAQITEPYIWKTIDIVDYVIKYFSH